MTAILPDMHHPSDTPEYQRLMALAPDPAHQQRITELVAGTEQRRKERAARHQAERERQYRNQQAIGIDADGNVIRRAPDDDDLQFLERDPA
jgi:hypothetical protein